MKVLVANRGEIAIRVIRALKELGLSSAAVYSQEDKDSQHVRMADEAWCIGPAPAKESYLNIGRVLTAARLSGAQAVHPGYGFLAENDRFATSCEEAGMVFIGPKGSVMASLANKFATKEIVRKAGVPVIPGSTRALTSAGEALEETRSMGFPVLLKASFGGGGRGITLVKTPEELPRAFDMAQAESKAAFGQDGLYLEKLLHDARHVEVQVARDLKGRVEAFVERDCTIQRRNQKLLEESPSPFIDQAARAKLLEAAGRAMDACQLTTLCTVEFLLLPDTKTFYFMEINKRIQVEHPVTEELLGLDLIRLQIAIAVGEPLTTAPLALGARHAIEARINAEDPAQGFLPGEGTVLKCALPGGPGVRVDTFLTPYMTLATSYDSLVAKIIAVSPLGRPAAIAKMRGALGELLIEGIPTTTGFHQRLMEDPVFSGGRQWFNIRYLETWLPQQRFN
ncbi:MAG: ATP-grasp domain-containing protein [Elusimicrobia bacterium]|nr:ATP-grasp domain-containing protein [Elusimicrobiota bacterium]